MKQGVPVNFSYICQVTQELFGSWISDNERLYVFGAEGASNSAFHLDAPDRDCCEAFSSLWFRLRTVRCLPRIELPQCAREKPWKKEAGASVIIS